MCGRTSRWGGATEPTSPWGTAWSTPKCLGTILEMGLLGLAAFFLLGASVVASARRTVHSRERPSAMSALAGATAAVVFLVLAMLFDSLAFPPDCRTSSCASPRSWRSSSNRRMALNRPLGRDSGPPGPLAAPPPGSADTGLVNAAIMPWPADGALGRLGARTGGCGRAAARECRSARPKAPAL